MDEKMASFRFTFRHHVVASENAVSRQIALGSGWNLRFGLVFQARLTRRSPSPGAD
jgi:hypothetical protein